MGDYFFVRDLEEEWKNLYENIERFHNRFWESIKRDYHRRPEFNRQSMEYNELLIALPRLLPLAKELQNDESLHCLMPWQHHGELDLLLMDWEKQTTQVFITILPYILPDRENEYQLSLYGQNLPLGNWNEVAQPLKTLESVPLGEIRSLIHAELQAKTVQQPNPNIELICPSLE